MTDCKEQPLTDEQMNELVFADVNDPTAWGDPVVAGPAKGPRRLKHLKHLELASKFYVLSVLHRLGADATLTFLTNDDADLTVVLESGKTLTIDVIALRGPNEWPVVDFRARAGHFLTFVWYPPSSPPNVSPSVYIVSSEELERFLAAHHDTSVSLTRLDEAVSAREAWQRLTVSTAA